MLVSFSHLILWYMYTNIEQRTMLRWKAYLIETKLKKELIDQNYMYLFDYN